MAMAEMNILLSPLPLPCRCHCRQERQPDSPYFELQNESKNTQNSIFTVTQSILVCFACSWTRFEAYYKENLPIVINGGCSGIGIGGAGGGTAKMQP
jgi:hypothetical protein